MTEDPIENSSVEALHADLVCVVKALDERSRKQLIFIFERWIERTVWIWISLTLAVSLIRSLSMFKKASDGSLLIGWALFSAALLIWSAIPLGRLRSLVMTSLTAEKRSDIYDRACGVKETLKTFFVLLVSFILFAIGMWFFAQEARVG